jgi:hypothetical protein
MLLMGKRQEGPEGSPAEYLMRRVEGDGRRVSSLAQRIDAGA